MSESVTHGPGHGGTQTGYRKDKCRCDECKTWKKADHEKERARKPDARPVSPSRVPVAVCATVVPTVFSTAKILTAVIPSAVIPSVSAENSVLQDMTDILATILNSLAIDPYWRRVITFDSSEEFDALLKVIDKHNRTVAFPRVQYGSHEGNFWVGAADAIDETFPAAVQPREPVPRTMPAPVVQLPQRAPLARPRNVRAGATPVVPLTPVRAVSHHHGAGNGSSVPEPIWGL